MFRLARNLHQETGRTTYVWLVVWRSIVLATADPAGGAFSLWFSRRLVMQVAQWEPLGSLVSVC
jgi:hypothetical protein